MCSCYSELGLYQLGSRPAIFLPRWLTLPCIVEGMISESWRLEISLEKKAWFIHTKGIMDTPTACNGNEIDWRQCCPNTANDGLLELQDSGSPSYGRTIFKNQNDTTGLLKIFVNPSKILWSRKPIQKYVCLYCPSGQFIINTVFVRTLPKGWGLSGSRHLLIAARKLKRPAITSRVKSN